MPNYRRAYVPGGTYFFTVVTYDRRPLFDREENRRLLGESMRECRRAWPFDVEAIVLLPDHLHTIWRLPPGDDRYSGRWSVIKKSFTEKFLSAGGSDYKVSPGKQREHRRGVWQRRFWEHAIEREADFDAHFDYIHFNPVKHGYVTCPREWLASSFLRWVEQGVYDQNWACGGHDRPDFSWLKSDFGEPT